MQGRNQFFCQKPDGNIVESGLLIFLAPMLAAHGGHGEQDDFGFRKIFLQALQDGFVVFQHGVGIVCADDVVNAKPAPDIALLALERYGAKGSEALVVGDSTFDMDMGRGADCDLCGVSFGSHTPEMLREKGARYVIDHFSELLKIALE